MKRSRWLRFLYAVRAWIDRRVPRDILMIELEENGQVQVRVSHLEIMGNLKRDPDSNAFSEASMRNRRLIFSIHEGYPR